MCLFSMVCRTTTDHGELNKFPIICFGGIWRNWIYQIFLLFLILVMYSSIIFSNSFLIVVICVHRSLHEPMYWFLCNLCVNEFYGSLAFYPSLLLNMLSNMHEISRVNCLVQIFCIHNYGSIEFFSLAVMAYDRYVSICHPLNYNITMTPAKVNLFIFMIWVCCTLKVYVAVNLSAWIPLCGNRINKIYCDNYSLVKLSCADITFNNIYGLVSLFFTVVVPALLIVYSYAIILKICLRASKESQIKAFKTCSPHLASLINFTIGCLFEVIQSRFDNSHFPSVYFFIFCPILNPIIHGVKYKKIRVVFKRLHTRKVTQQ